MSTCCPCVEQCFGHPVYGSVVRVNQPTCQEMFLGGGEQCFSISVVGTDHFFGSFFRLLAVSHGFDNHLLRPFVFDFLRRSSLRPLVEPTQFHFSASCSEPRVHQSLASSRIFIFVFSPGGFISVQFSAPHSISVSQP